MKTDQIAKCALLLQKVVDSKKAAKEAEKAYREAAGEAGVSEQAIETILAEVNNLVCTSIG